MESDVSKEIWFLINSKSGANQERKKIVASVVQARLDSSTMQGRIVYTEYAGHAIEIAQEAVDKGVGILVGVGGDGTLNEIASVLCNSATSLGIIPAGSGNGLARHLRIPFNIKRAVDVIQKGYQINADTISVNNKTVVSISGIGFDAAIADAFHATSKRGFMGYFTHVLKRYFTYKTDRYKITVDDGEVFEQNAFMVCCANSSQFGYEFRIAPRAKVDDGFFDLVIVSHTSFLEYFEKLKHPFDYKSFNDYLFLYRRVKRVVVERENPGFVNIDGEAVEMGERVVFAINEAALKMIIPKENRLLPFKNQFNS